MKRLTLVRHAKSTWDFPELNDLERPLNLRGLRNAPMMGYRLASAGFSRPGLIISSPAVRALETARILAGKLAFPASEIMVKERLYLATVEELLAVLAEQDPAMDHIILVGHNPGLTEFVNFLCPNLTPNLPTAGVVAVLIDQADWNLAPGGLAPKNTLLLFDFPKKPL